MVMNDAPQPVDPHVFLRGNPGRPGPAVPRRFLKVLSGSDRPPFQKGSGRLELAQAIADARQPADRPGAGQPGLAVAFRQGAGRAHPATSALRSDPPSHPELLDYLAGEFIASGWSIKALHRRIMLSSTYQQQSEPRPDAAGARPGEPAAVAVQPPAARLRVDARLGAGGLRLARPAIGGPSVADRIDRPFSTRRTLYGFIDRQNLDGVYRTFDFAVPDATSPRRFVTTVPQQALFLMNSPFLHEQARRLCRERSCASRAAAGVGADADRGRSPAVSPRPRPAARAR